jgi:protein SCO1/2
MFGKNLLVKTFMLSMALVWLSGCQDKSPGSATTSTDTNRQVFQVKGVLKELKQNGKTVVIAHEEIPNYMVAMTMDFDVKEKSELKGLQPGDYLSFQMVVTKDDGWIENVRKIPGAAPSDAGKVITLDSTNGTNAGPITFRRSPIVEPLSLGDKVPDYKFTNQFGTPISLAQYQGRALGVTFIFTRCPFPTFCPRMSQFFQKAQATLKKQSVTNWALLSLSFDPAWDTPERLLRYATPYNLDSNHWQFATSDLWTVDGFSEQVGMTFYRATPTSLPEHNLRTLVIDAKGRLQKIYLGNEWTPEEFAEEMLKAAAAK